jgi:hypothetical protein
MANLDWPRVNARLRAAVGQEVGVADLFLPAGAPSEAAARIAGEELREAMAADNTANPYLLDVCLPVDVPKRIDMLLGAVFRPKVVRRPLH